MKEDRIGITIPEAVKRMGLEYVNSEDVVGLGTLITAKDEKGKLFYHIIVDSVNVLNIIFKEKDKAVLGIVCYYMGVNPALVEMLFENKGKEEEKEKQKKEAVRGVTITKKGNSEKEFKCSCGCEFKVKRGFYEKKQIKMNEFFYYKDCPECGKECFSSC